MKVLLVAPRAPWPSYTGDRARANMWIEALRDHVELVVVTTPTASPGNVEVIVAKRSLLSLLSGVMRTIANRAPLHTLLTASWNWRDALQHAQTRHGEFDAAIVLLTRTDPAVFRFLPAKRRILDAIDSAARGMRERTVAAGNPLSRLFWRAEGRCTETLERNAAQRYDAIVTVAQEETAVLGANAVTIPMGVEVAPDARDVDQREHRHRRYDFGFWGRFPYFANEEALRVLLDEIWPEIRRRRPTSTLFIGGADAPPSLRARDGHDGITVVSPVSDRHAAMRQVRVALLPILRGTGQSLKTLEMAEAGCAIVGASMAFRGVEELAAEGVVEDDMSRFAERGLALLDSDTGAIGARLRAIVVAQHDRPRSLERMRELVLAGARS